jgi:hypothetical protein
LKLWQSSKKKKKSRGGFFSKFFGYQENAGDTSPTAPAGRGGGAGGGGGGGGSHGMTDKEQSLSRSLELAQSRVTQLLSELEAVKEAQMIVLETKEAVMRSLARQNAQLNLEVCLFVCSNHFFCFFFIILPTVSSLSTEG